MDFRDMPSIETLFADRVRINFSWLITLRWAAVLGQLVTILVAAYGLGVDLPVPALALIVGFTATTNAGLLAARRGRWSFSQAGRGMVLGSIMTGDILLLTLLLYYSGGPFNPFDLFYLVNIALAAVLLPPRWSWLVYSLAMACHTALFASYWRWMSLGVPGAVGVGVEAIPRRLYLIGHFVATAIAATTTVYFVTRLTTEMGLLDEELNQARQRKARTEKLEGLATLAAGAAHELASPLSTIAVVAKELEKHLRDADVPAKLRDDLKLIRSELGRCREILDHMAANAGETMGEPLVAVDPERLAADALGLLRQPERVHLDLDGSAGTAAILGPAQTLAQVLRGLLQNALDASGPEALIDLVVRVEPDRRWVRIEVRDRGAGMPDEILSRVGEPFFTTKEPGRGMGLGLFLARSVIERLDGTLDLRSTPGRGTTAGVRLPLIPT